MKNTIDAQRERYLRGRERRLAALDRVNAERRIQPGMRELRARLQLPPDAAETFARLNARERTAVILAGLKDRA